MAGSANLNFVTARKKKMHDNDNDGTPAMKHHHHQPTITTLSSSNSVENCLPPENELGNIEYKSQLINPSLSRLQHLSTQMYWRITEGDGEAIYHIGVNDDGTFTGLSESQMDASLQTIHAMADSIHAEVTILNQRVICNATGDKEPKFSVELLVRKSPGSNLKANIRLAIIGSAQSGKSTLCGVLTQGKLDNGNGQARIAIFRHLHEFRSGKTSSICVDLIGFSKDRQLLNYKENSLEEIHERSSKLLSLIDLAGDRKFLKTTIYGVSGYNPHYCALIVNARSSISPITEEHFGLAIALGIPLFIVITKIDLVRDAQLERILDSVQKLVECTEFKIRRISNNVEVDNCIDEMRSSSIIPVFCISNVTGQNLDMLVYFLAHLPQLDCLPLLKNVESPQRCLSSEEKPLFYVEDLVRSDRVGTIICGLLAEGNLAEGDRIKFGPDQLGGYFAATVDSIHKNKQPVAKLSAGDSASIVLSGGPEQQQEMANTIKRGMVLVDEDGEELCCWEFTARFYLLYHPNDEICIGFQGTVYIGPLRRTVVISDFTSPCIFSHIWTKVTFQFRKQPEFLRVGMPLILRQGHVKGMGNITGIRPRQMTLSVTK